MIQNNYNYSNSSPYFGSKFEADAIKRLQKVSSPGLENCIEAFAERIQSWGNDEFVISLKKQQMVLNSFLLKTQITIPKKSD